VTQRDPTGTYQLYSSYVGGTGGDFGLSVACDGAGNIYVTGETDSIYFPHHRECLEAGSQRRQYQRNQFRLLRSIQPRLARPRSGIPPTWAARRAARTSPNSETESPPTAPALCTSSDSRVHNRGRRWRTSRLLRPRFSPRRILAIRPGPVSSPNSTPPNREPLR
jgi:hypothetical protein